MIGMRAADSPVASEPTPRGISMFGRRFCTTSRAVWYAARLISDSLMTSAAPRVVRLAADGCAAEPDPPPPHPSRNSPAAHNTAFRMFHLLAPSAAHTAVRVQFRPGIRSQLRTGLRSAAAESLLGDFLQEAPACAQR